MQVSWGPAIFRASQVLSNTNIWGKHSGCFMTIRQRPITYFSSQWQNMVRHENSRTRILACKISASLGHDSKQWWCIDDVSNGCPNQHPVIEGINEYLLKTLLWCHQYMLVWSKYFYSPGLFLAAPLNSKACQVPSVTSRDSMWRNVSVARSVRYKVPQTSTLIRREKQAKP